MSSPRKLRCVLAQLNLVVGDVEGNTSRIIAAANRAREDIGADVVMVPELAVSGYPPEDLLFHSGMRSQVARSIGRLKAEVRGITLIAGYPEYDGTISSIPHWWSETAPCWPTTERPACPTTAYSTRSAISRPGPSPRWSS